MNKYVQIHEWFEDFTVSRIMGTAALAGTFVKIASPTAFAVANEFGASYMLVQEVADLSTTDKILRDTFPGDVIRPKADLDDVVSARRVRLGEWEGDSYMKAASTGLINGATADDTPLSFEGGLWYVAQSGDEVKGYLRDQLTPLHGGTARILVELI